MSETFETVLCTRPAEHVLQITLNRPDVGNALNTKMGEELRDLFTRDPGDLRCIIFTGSGEKIFCGGGDLKQRNGMSNDDWLAQHRIFEQFYWAMMDYPVPIICGVNGHAFGGGLEMVLAADFAYSVPAAKFALTETKLGIMPGGGGTQNLSRAVGERRAKELIFSAKPFTADEALAWGVLNRICEPKALLRECLETATAIAANGPLAVRQAKKSIHHGLQTDISRGLWLEVEAYNRLVFTEDRLEGVSAFNEKRVPKFSGK
jgi:enoyl-CoA hydratase/carnithine racemase